MAVLHPEQHLVLRTSTVSVVAANMNSHRLYVCVSLHRNHNVIVPRTMQMFERILHAV